LHKTIIVTDRIILRVIAIISPGLLREIEVKTCNLLTHSTQRKTSYFRPPK
jgi:hypothetical protein